MATSGRPDTESGHPRIPGVRYKKVRRTRLVETTFNGETRTTRQTYYEWEPAPPRNLDALYLRAVITIAVLLTLIAVVWSTTAIGRLLGGLVPGHEATGYLAACAFEVPWVVCLMIQWLLRYEPDRARAVSRAGWVGLAIVVTAVVVDGAHLDMVEVGIIGAFVSVVAKGLWWVIFRLFRVELGEDAAGWLQSKREDLAVGRVLLGEQQRMRGVEAYLQAVYGASGPALPSVSPDTAPDTPPVARPDTTDSRSQGVPDIPPPAAQDVSVPVSAPPSPTRPDNSAP
ncbi:hypothetical protein, partial [Streptomyces boncukensis]